MSRREATKQTGLNQQKNPGCSRFHLARLREGARPLQLHWYPRLRSTNDQAMLLRERQQLFAPAIVLTGRQIAGRGRGDHAWWSGPGCLTATFVFAADAQADAHRVPLLAGLAVRNALARSADNDSVLLKWPNDIVCAVQSNGSSSTHPDLRKIGGLLCERVHGIDLIGVGINVNLHQDAAPAPLSNRLSSLSRLAGRDLDLTDLLLAIARHLHRAMCDGGDKSFQDTLREYDSHHALIGRVLSIVSGGPPVEGRCEGLDSMGRLLLRSGSKLHHVIAGQVVLK